MENKAALKKKLITALAAMLAALLAVSTATFAWYIYNTRAHTTKVHMAAGSSISLEISNQYEGPYGTAAVLDSFYGYLKPVSTNRIRGGFQIVDDFIDGEEGQPKRIAALFRQADGAEYYTTTLFLRSKGGNMDIYLSDIGFDDSSEDYPISTAIRVGFVVHEPGNFQPDTEEYIFAINMAKNLKKEYNTITGYEGCVLDCTKTDGSTIEFTPYNPDNYCNYDRDTGEVTLKGDSLKLFTLEAEPKTVSESVQVDVYIWLEGCDEDCTDSLCATNLQNLAISFAGYY